MFLRNALPFFTKCPSAVTVTTALVATCYLQLNVAEDRQTFANCMWNSSGSVWEGMVVLCLTGGKRFFSVQAHSDWLRCSPSLQFSGYDGFCLEMWLLGALNDHTPSSNAEVKNAELCCSSPYVFMAYSGKTLVASVCGTCWWGVGVMLCCPVSFMWQTFTRCVQKFLTLIK